MLTPPRNTPQGTILVIEPEVPTAVSLAIGLQEAGFRVLQAADGHHGLQLARAAQPDLVLLDAHLPRMNGLTLCRALRNESPVPILLLVDPPPAGATHFERASHLQVRGLELGADACLVKPVPFRELLARVRALLRRRALNNGNGPPPADRIVVGDIVLDRATRRVWRAGRPVHLRRREFDLLCVLMENAGRAVPRQELLARVWGENWVGSPRTLDVHIHWLREKLEEDPAAPRYIQTVRGYGHRLLAAGD